MSSFVFKLQSDKQFITSIDKCSQQILVLEYKGDPHGFDFCHSNSTTCWSSIIVGPSSGTAFMALEVWGVTIGGEQFKELVKDLTFSGMGTSLFYVNRQGLCYLKIGSGTSIARLRISDRFGWSKYGVEVPDVRTTSWGVYDMSNGDVLSAPRVREPVGGEDDGKVKNGGGGGGGEINHEENNNCLKVCGGWKKVVEEKEKEVASLKAALRALIGDK